MMMMKMKMMMMDPILVDPFFCASYDSASYFCKSGLPFKVHFYFLFFLYHLSIPNIDFHTVEMQNEFWAELRSIREEYSFVSYSYHFFNTNIFGYSFVSFFYTNIFGYSFVLFFIRIYSDIRSYCFFPYEYIRIFVRIEISYSSHYAMESLMVQCVVIYAVLSRSYFCREFTHFWV